MTTSRGVKALAGPSQVEAFQALARPFSQSGQAKSAPAKLFYYFLIFFFTLLGKFMLDLVNYIQDILLSFLPRNLSLDQFINWV